MPYPKTHLAYPGSMKDLVYKVGRDRLTVSIPCESLRKARGVRGRFYQYIAAIRRDAERPGKLIDQTDIIELVKAAFNVELNIDEATAVLTISPRDSSKFNDLLAKATVSDTAPSKEMTLEEQASLERLLSKLNMEVKDLK